MNRRAAFTLIELLIVMAILGVLVTMLVPVITGQIEEARRKSCQANLHAIGQKMFEYAHDNKGRLPSAYPTKIGMEGVRLGLGDPSYAWKGNSCSMYLLVLQEYVPPEAFICPSTDHEPTRLDVVPNQDDFEGYLHLSYAMHIQARSRGAPERGPFPLTLVSSAGMAIMADRSPIAGETGWVAWSGAMYPRMEVESPRGGYDEMQNNSFNHDQDGQNVVFMDGRAEWCTTPKVGVNQDNIWTYDDGTAWGSTTGRNATGGDLKLRYSCPADSTDSLLYP